MSGPRVTVLKIGGSVITDKNGELAARTQEMDRLSGEIKKAGITSLIVVHGGGSFGHPLAEKYGIREGLREDSQKIGFSETHHVMTVLNGLFMDSLIWRDVPAVSITPSSCIITENGRIKHFVDSPIEALLKLGFIPVLYGDAVMDLKLGFTILSGDQLVSSLAIRFNAERIVMGVDVDGLYDADPKVEKTAKMFTRLGPEELKGLQNTLKTSATRDVTGGMLGKVAELLPAVEKGIDVMMVNALKHNNVFKVLEGKPVEGTVIKKD